MDQHFSSLGSETHGDPEAHNLANVYFDNLRNSENGFQISMALLTQMVPCDQLVKYICLDIIENYICKRYIFEHTDEEKTRMRNFLLSYAHAQGRQHPRRFFDSEDNRNKAAIIFGLITAQCTDTDVSSDIFDAFLIIPKENFVRSDLFLRVLRQIASLVLIPEYISSTISLMQPYRLITTFINIIDETSKTPKNVIAQELQNLCLRVIRIYAPWLHSACESLTRAALPCLPNIDAIRCIISLVRSANYCLIDNILSRIEPLAKELSKDFNITNDYSKQAVLIEIANLLVSTGLRILNLCYENPTDAENLLRRVFKTLFSQIDVANVTIACNISLRCISFVTRLVRIFKVAQLFPLDPFSDDLLDPILEKIQLCVDRETSLSNTFISMYNDQSLTNNYEIELQDLEGETGLDYFGTISIMKVKPRRLRECLATLICIVSKLSPYRSILKLEELIKHLIKKNSRKTDLPFLIAELPLTLILVISRIISQMKQEFILNNLLESERCLIKCQSDSDCVLNRIMDLLLENPQIATNGNDLIMIRYIEALINCVLHSNLTQPDERIASITEYTIGSFGLQNTSAKEISFQAASFLHELIMIKGQQVSNSVPQLSIKLKKILETIETPNIRLLIIESIARLIQEEPSDKEEKRETIQFLIAPAIKELNLPLSTKNNKFTLTYIYSTNKIAIAIREITGILRAFNSPKELDKCDGISILLDAFPSTIPYLNDKALHPLLLQLFYQFALSLNDDFLPLLSKTLLMLRSITDFIGLHEYMSLYAKMIRLYGMKIINFLSEDFQPAGEHIFRCLADYTSRGQTGQDEIFQTAFLNFLTSLSESNTLVPILQKQSPDFNKKVFSLLIISSNDSGHLDSQLQSLIIFQNICKNYHNLLTLPSNFSDFMVRDIILVCIKVPFKLYSKLVFSSKFANEHPNVTDIKNHDNEEEVGLNEIIKESVILINIIHQTLGDKLIESLRNNTLPYLCIPHQLSEEFISNLQDESVNFNSYMRQFIEKARPLIIQEHYPIKSTNP